MQKVAKPANHKWLLAGDGLTDPSTEFIVCRHLYSEQRELPYVSGKSSLKLKKKDVQT